MKLLPQRTVPDMSPSSPTTSQEIGLRSLKEIIGPLLIAGALLFGKQGIQNNVDVSNWTAIRYFVWCKRAGLRTESPELPNGGRHARHVASLRYTDRRGVLLVTTDNKLASRPMWVENAMSIHVPLLVARLFLRSASHRNHPAA